MSNTVVFVDLVLFVTIIRSSVCVTVYVHVCVMCMKYHGLFGQCSRMWLVSCLLLLVICSLRYCSTVTSLCLICLVSCLIILPVFITQMCRITLINHCFPLITPCVHGLLSFLWNQHWIVSCWLTQWARALCCLVLCYINNSGCLLPAVSQCPGLLLRHQFSSIVASWCDPPIICLFFHMGLPFIHYK